MMDDLFCEASVGDRDRRSRIMLEDGCACGGAVLGCDGVGDEGREDVPGELAHDRTMHFLAVGCLRLVLGEEDATDRQARVQLAGDLGHGAEELAERLKGYGRA